MVDIITTASWSWSPSILLHGCDHHYCCYFVVVITISTISWSWLPSLLLLHGHGRHRYYYFLIMVTIIVIVSWSWLLAAIIATTSFVEARYFSLSYFVQVWGVKCGA
jgi:hypothetical protein